ncbi:hypothetical protein [Roseibium litorale]|uniref:Uncharacterized protein n=1 Tax=Roseibium litorale TaxID=2803841 RepID=A0ABR9CRG9_9HYPH|nr:hypothetical protein [Roseibium litorale]MBD8893477.1 hypothetical protein [Roseibium litorale]
MTNPELVSNKIRSYLQDLSPKAVEGLVRSLERARAEGATDPHYELILTVSAQMLRQVQPDDLGNRIWRVRQSQVQRKFFQPLEEFLITEFLPTKQEGRIHRDMLDRVWTWLGRDLLPSDVKKVLDLALRPKVSDDKLDMLVANLRKTALDAMSDALHQIERSDKERRRLSIEVGGERGIADLKDINKIFGAEDWLMPLLQVVPETLNDKKFRADTSILRIVQRCSERFPDHVPVVAVALMERADSPSDLACLAGRLANSNDAKVISASRFAPFVDVVLSEAERLNVLAQDHRKYNPDPVAFSMALSDYHTLVKGLEQDLELSHSSTWHKRLSETKREISAAVTGELQNAMGAVRRSLQVPKADSEGVLQIDNASIDEAVRALRTAVMVKNASETFAVNDIGKRTRQVIEQTLEIVTRSLISDLGNQPDQSLKAHLSAVDTAIMLSEIYFGGDYAAQLRRSRQTAIEKQRTLPKKQEHSLTPAALHASAGE